MQVKSYLKGEWVEGDGASLPVYDPSSGDVIAQIKDQGLDLAGALAWGREVGGEALRAMTFAECVNDISSAAGYSVRLVEVPLDAYIQALRDQDVPKYLVELLRELFTDLFDGRNAYTAEDVREALGRPANDFTEYARKTAASGAWVRAHAAETA